MSLVVWMKFPDSVGSGALVRSAMRTGPRTVVVAIAGTVTYSVFAPILRRTGDHSDNREAVG